ncbi:nucleotidyltransferase family protein [Xylophilus sp.]|uniref:nucleotidyltransferase family protein n=1 Tax=Xylophilus sp. TaxID=2653893 RepID=UPI0013B72284|nr:NTP transferase domain-containing protein [Xylophilus sp.]KAF1048263.1 MAG: N-acetylmuramate alpha-1-phosphate uridylyltransferase [Xylophilus sp.]
MVRLPSHSAPASALILAAGRGARMRPLTDSTPKPLLAVQGRPLMQWAMEALAAGGAAHVVVNTGWLGQQIQDRFGARVGLDNGRVLAVSYSREELDFGYALETQGGIARALPLLEEVFWVASGDVLAPDFAFDEAVRERFAASGELAHLWLVPNPDFHPDGDFAFDAGGRIHNAADPEVPRYTFSNLALFRRAFFGPPLCDIAFGNPQGLARPLVALLRAGIDAGVVGASLYQGRWANVGTPAQLAVLDAGAPLRSDQ